MPNNHSSHPDQPASFALPPPKSNPTATPQIPTAAMSMDARELQSDDGGVVVGVMRRWRLEAFDACLYAVEIGTIRGRKYQLKLLVRYGER
jgi:hypothetical protein